MRSAVYLWRAKADDLTIVLSDGDALCDAITRGGWPRASTMWMATLKQGGDARDAPFSRGEYPLREAGVRRARDTKQASFTVLDDACAPSVSKRATAGVVRLSTTEVKLGGVAEGTFELTMEGGERLDGAFVATHCPTPDLEPSGCR